MKKLYLSIILCYLSLATMAQDYQLKLQSGKQPSKIAVEQYSAQRQVFTQSKFGAGTYVILQFQQIPDETAKLNIRSKGITLLNYLPNYAFWAYLPDNVNAETLKNVGVKGVYPYEAEDKISMLFKGKTKPMWAIKENGKYDVYIQLYNNIGVEQAKNILQNYSWIKIINEKAMPNTIELRIPIDRVNDVAKMPMVFYVEPTNPEPYLENREATSNHRINFMNSEYSAGRKYDGTGVVVSMGDDGTADTHMDKKGRITNNLTTNSGNHGDHVSGIIMGAGNINPLMKGQAPGAQLEVYSGHADIDGMPAPYNDKGVKITSHSLGETLNAGYTSGAVAVDQQIRQFPDLMHVFSSGNSGEIGNGFFTITGGRKAGKNVMAVGNLTKTDAIASSSSRGPSADGRLKPEICAVGTNVNSTGENNTYYSATGTSMACPAISGTLAAMYHAYKSLNGNTNPSSALIKGILMNTADDLGNAGPDYIYGYGRVNARRAVLTLENNQYFQNNVSQGVNRTHSITVPAGTKQLKVMLYWNDFEGAASASVPLVNNIDLTITTPASTTVQPWILDSANPSNVAVRGVDNRNNSEQVTIDDPAAGSYTINISGTAIPQGPQNYVVVYEFVKDEIVVTFPLGGEALHPTENEVIRWDAWGTSGTFTVEYSTNNGGSWTSISSSVAGTNRSLTWTVPNTPSGQALVRVTRGAQSSQSIANFSIQAPPTGLSITSGCSGVNLSWTASAGATSYEVFRLGTKYMELVGSSNTTSYTDATAPVGEHWYAVRAVGGNNGAYSRRTVASKHNYAADIFVANITPKNNVCELTNSQDITVVVGNLSPFAITNTTLNYTIKKSNNDVVKSGSVNIANLAANASQNIVLNADLSIPNEKYTILASLSNSCDKNAANNELSVEVTKVGVNVEISLNQSTLVATSGYRNYRWFFNDALLTSTGTSNQLVINQVGTYKVEAQLVSGSCKSMSKDFVVAVLALEDVSEQLGIFPNPTTDKLQVSLPKEFTGNHVLEITDVSGRKVYQKTVQDGLKQNIDLNNLPKGVYILEIRNEKYKAIKKVIKQ